MDGIFRLVSGRLMSIRLFIGGAIRILLPFGLWQSGDKVGKNFCVPLCLEMLRGFNRHPLRRSFDSAHDISTVENASALPQYDDLTKLVPK